MTERSVGIEEEPPEGSVVVDRDGDRWRHVQGGWLLLSVAHDGTREPWKWDDLDVTYGPLMQA